MNACHASCHHVQRLLFALPRCDTLFGSWLPGFVNSLHTRQRGEAGDPLDARAALRRDLVPRDHESRDRDERGSRQDDEREDPAVVGTHRPRLPVARDSRQGERDPEDGRPGAAAERERRQALDAPAVEEDPRRGGHARKRDAEARVREEQRHNEAVEEHRARRARLRRPRTRSRPERKRHACVAEERKLVPVAERRAQPRDASVVRVKRRNTFREQRVAHEEGEQDGGAGGETSPRQPRPGEQADEREGRVDDGAVRVAPRPVGRDRPDGRHPAPHGEPEERGAVERRRAVEPRRRQHAEEGGPDAERGQNEREPTDPGERGGGKPASEEDRAERDNRRAQRGPRPAGPFARSAHGR